MSDSTLPPGDRAAAWLAQSNKLSTPYESHVLQLAPEQDFLRPEQQLSAVLNAMRCLLWMAIVRYADGHFHFNIRITNEASAQQFLPLDVPPDSTYTNTYMTSRPEEEQQRMHENFSTALLSGQSGYRQEFRCIAAGGEIRWLFEDVSVEQIEPNVWRLVGVCTDITTHKQLEQRLQEQQEFQSQLLNLIPQAIFVKDADGRFLFANQTLASWYGTTPEGIINTTDTDFNTITDEVEGYRRDDLEVLRTGEPKLIPLESSTNPITGETRSWQTIKMPLKTASGDIRGILGVATDITEQRLAEETLLKERNLLRTLIDSLPERVFIKDKQHRFIMVNTEAMCGIGAASLEELVGKTDFDIHPPELAAQYQADEIKVLQEGQSLYSYEELISDYGHDEQRWFSTTKVPLRDAQGNIIGLVGINRDITEHKRDQSRLEEERKLLRTVIDNLPDNVYSKDLDSRFTIANQICATWLGSTSPEELIGKTDFDFLSPALSQTALEEEQTIIRTGKTLVDVEHNMIDADGKQHWWLVTKVPLHDAEGSITGIVGINRNITRQKIEEEKLRRQNEYLAALQETTLALIEHHDPSDILEAVTRRVVQLLGTQHVYLYLEHSKDKATLEVGLGKFSEHVGMALWPGHGLTGLVWHTGQPMTVDNYQVWEGRTSRVTNQPPMYAVIGVPVLSGGRVIGVIGAAETILGRVYGQEEIDLLTRFAQLLSITLDNARLYNAAQQEIADRIRAEEALRESEALYRLLAENSNDLISRNLPSGVFLYASPASRVLLGYEPHELVGKNSVDFFHPEDAQNVIDLHRKLWDDQESITASYRIQRKNGTYLWFETTSRPIRNPDGEIIELVSVSRDSTERIEAEVKLRRAWEQERQLGELKARFVTMISHEFRTPLTLIRTSSDSLDRYSAQMTAERRQEHLEQIQQQIVHLAKLLEDIIMIAKAETVGLEFIPHPFDLAAFCHDIIGEMQLFAQGTHKVIFSGHNYECENAVMDERLIRQIVTNLLTNALKYSPHGGNVFFDLHCIDGQAIMKVRDTGIGIPEEDQKHLFEVFHRARNVGQISGSGLGLAIVKQAVDLHGGTIKVESTLNVGTSFIVTVPLIAGRA